MTDKGFDAWWNSMDNPTACCVDCEEGKRRAYRAATLAADERCIAVVKEWVDETSATAIAAAIRGSE